MYLTSKKILIFIKTYGLTKKDVKTIDSSANGREVAGNRERETEEFFFLRNGLRSQNPLPKRMNLTSDWVTSW